MAKLSERSKELIELELERSRLNREKSVLVLNKALFLYFCFLFVGVIGFVNNYVTTAYLNLLIILALVALIVGIFPYVSVMSKEEKRTDNLIASVKRGGKWN